MTSFKTPRPMVSAARPRCHGDHEHGEECPVFWTKLIGLGQSTDVKGIDKVKPGTVYSFFCTIHPGMKGKLIVAP